jgi:hypothetical protein
MTSPGEFHSQHGFAASPILYGAGVIVNGQQDGEAFVVMLDRRTPRPVVPIADSRPFLPTLAHTRTLSEL